MYLDSDRTAGGPRFLARDAFLRDAQATCGYEAQGLDRPRLMRPRRSSVHSRASFILMVREGGFSPENLNRPG